MCLCFCQLQTDGGNVFIISILLFFYIYIFLFAQFAKNIALGFVICAIVYVLFYNFVLLIDSVSYRAHTVHTNQALTNKMLQFFTSDRRKKNTEPIDNLILFLLWIVEMFIIYIK